MPHETIVAVFDTGAHADSAARALEQAGVPSGAIERHSKEGESRSRAETPGQGAAPQPTGFFFWDMMLGAQASHQDRPAYQRSMEGGKTVLAVTVSERDADAVMAVLERHSPLDLDSEYTAEEEAATDAASERAPRAATGQAAAGRTTEGEEVIPLAEEKLQVGKRTVNRGTTRLRRYVVETPVEQQVSLRDEEVTIERRKPVTDAVTGDVFTEKTVEVTETSEVPVTEKVARLKEEVVVRRQGTERTETVRDTVREDKIAVEETDETAPKGRKPKT